MDELFKWLSGNTTAATTLVVTLGVLVTAVTLMFLVAFFQKRPVSLWPPKIGAPPDRAVARGADSGLTRGMVVSKEDRSSVSQAFTRSALRSVRIFAGDVRNWFEEDLAIYGGLCRRGVRVQVLVDEATSPAMPTGKATGVEFRQYPRRMRAPLKASVFDTEDETECKALVVKKRAPRAGAQQSADYEYWMKSYYGPADAPVIRAMSTLFDELYSSGEPL